MQILRVFHANRLVCWLGLLPLASGCGDQNPVTAVSSEAGKEQGEAQRKAREAQYGAAGVPKGRPNAPAK